MKKNNNKIINYWLKKENLRSKKQCNNMLVYRTTREKRKKEGRKILYAC